NSPLPILTGHERPGDPCTIVIFGASGDLTKRKLLPALYNLKALKLLLANFAFICIIVIVAACADMSNRKLLPALYILMSLKLLPANFAVIGVAVSEGNDEMYRNNITENIKQFATRPVDEKEWDDFARRSYYIQGDFKAIE